MLWIDLLLKSINLSKKVYKIFLCHIHRDQIIFADKLHLGASRNPGQTPLGFVQVGGIVKVVFVLLPNVFGF